MAGSSSSQSTTTTRGQSSSDTYIPEYSESPFLLATAELARQRSNEVYEWGRSVYDRNQGQIDSLMRDALSYASPQRIAVDMGMAEAGVMQAGERGRQSAIRDLESYGIDPSSGRYAALDSANRVMTAAAAAGAGNQQRMASQAAGNAMRNQAIAAGLQNANFGSQANRDANAYLATAMSLKYPPLGRWSQSTNATDSQSTSQSQQTDPAGGGSKGGGGDKPPAAPKQQAAPGGAAAKPTKPADFKDTAPTKKGGGGGGGGKGPGYKPDETPPDDPTYDPGLGTDIPPDDPNYDPGLGTDIPPDDLTYDPGAGIPQEGQGQPEFMTPDYTGSDLPPIADPYADLPPPDERFMQPTNQTTDPLENVPMGDYDPYAGNTQTAAFEAPLQIDPITGEPVEQTEAGEVADPAGSMYAMDEASGGWTYADYTGQDYGTPDDTWSDIGQGSYEEQPTEVTEEQAYDSTYDDPWTDALDYVDEQDYSDFGDIGDDYYGDLGDYGDFDEADYDYGDYDDAYGDWNEQDYYDDAYGDYDYGDEGDYDYGDYDEGDYDYDYGDYGDEGDYDYDYGDYGEDEEDFYEDEEDFYDEEYDEYDDSYEDYTEEDYDEAYDDTDYSEEGGGGEEYYDDSAGDYGYADEGGDYSDSGGDEGARGGAVMRGRMRRGKRRARIMPPPGARPRPRTGYRARPPMRRPMRRRVPAFAGGGQMPGRMDPPPQAPMGKMRRPQQAPRPARGAPMMAPGGPTPTPMGRGPRPMPGNFISANGMPPPTAGGMQRPVQRMAGGGQAGRRAEPTTGGFVSHSLSPSGGSQVDDVNARLNAGEFVVPKDVAAWKGREFFYKLIATARKNRSGGNEKPQVGYGGNGSSPRGMQ